MGLGSQALAQMGRGEFTTYLDELLSKHNREALLLSINNSTIESWNISCVTEKSARKIEENIFLFFFSIPARVGPNQADIFLMYHWVNLSTPACRGGG
jgi:hypothetical protein